VEGEPGAGLELGGRKNDPLLSVGGIRNDKELIFHHRDTEVTEDFRLKT
jgi:hypothetical protein